MSAHFVRAAGDQSVLVYMGLDEEGDLTIDGDDLAQIEQLYRSLPTWPTNERSRMCTSLVGMMLKEFKEKT